MKQWKKFGEEFIFKTQYFKGSNNYSEPIELNSINDEDVKKVLLNVTKEMENIKEGVIEYHMKTARIIAKYPDVITALPYYMRHISPDLKERDEVFENINYKVRSHGVDFYNIEMHSSPFGFPRTYRSSEEPSSEDIEDFVVKKIKDEILENLKGRIEEQWINFGKGKEYMEPWIDIPNTISIFMDNLNDAKPTVKLFGLKPAYIIPLVEDSNRETEGIKSNNKYAISKSSTSNKYLLFIDKKKKVEESRKVVSKMENYCKFFNPSAKIEYIATSKKAYILMLRV